MTTADAVPFSASRAATLARLTVLARFLDSAFRLPGTRIRFGADGVLGLIPGLGDGLAALLSLYIVAEAWRLGAPGPTLARMLGNIALDTAIGAVPLIGDLFDVAFKANNRNVRLLIDHLEA